MTHYNDMAHVLDFIDVDHVHQWISTKLLVNDLEPELINLYPRSRHNHKIILQIFHYLYRHESATQTDIQERFFGISVKDAMACSRMLHKMQEHEYVHVEKEGRQNLWSLAR